MEIDKTRRNLANISTCHIFNKCKSFYFYPVETIQGIFKFKSQKSIAITIGTFDGVHIGHQQILKRLINNAKSADLNAVLLTFFPHPRMVLQKESNIKLLNTLEEKIEILKSLGLDYVIVNPFTKEFSRLTAT